MSGEEKYHPDVLKRLWDLDYREIEESPGQPGMGGYTEARFVMQSKAALEARSLTEATVRLAERTAVLARGTVVLAIATVVLAFATAILAARS